MKIALTNTAAAAALSTLVACVAFAAGAAYAAGNTSFVNRPADQIEFQDVPGLAGISKADLWGDSEKGEHGSLTMFRAGTHVPEHAHTQDLKLVVLRGTMVFSDEGKEVRLGPGSYRYEPAGLMHLTSCTVSADCEFLEMQPGAFDVTLTESTPK